MGGQAVSTYDKSKQHDSRHLSVVLTQDYGWQAAVNAEQHLTAVAHHPERVVAPTLRQPQMPILTTR